MSELDYPDTGTIDYAEVELNTPVKNLTDPTKKIKLNDEAEITLPSGTISGKVSDLFESFKQHVPEKIEELLDQLQYEPSLMTHEKYEELLSTAIEHFIAKQVTSYLKSIKKPIDSSHYDLEIHELASHQIQLAEQWTFIRHILNEYPKDYANNDLQLFLKKQIESVPKTEVDILELFLERLAKGDHESDDFLKKTLNEISEIIRYKPSNDNDSEQKEEVSETEKVWNMLNELGEIIENDVLAENKNSNISEITSAFIQNITTHSDKITLKDFLNEKYDKLNTDNNLCNTCVEYLLEELLYADFSDENGIIDSIKTGINEINGIDFDLLELDKLDNHRILRKIQELTKIVETEFNNLGDVLLHDYEISETLSEEIEQIIKISNNLDFDSFQNLMHSKQPNSYLTVDDNLQNICLSMVIKNLVKDHSCDTNSTYNKIKNAIKHSIYQTFIFSKALSPNC